MSVVRVVKRQSPYVIMDKSSLNDSKMRWRSKGLLAYLLSLPDNWHVNMADLENRSADGREGLRGAMAELIRCGYVDREKIKDEEGKMRGYEYVVYEVPEGGHQQPELGLTSEADVRATGENEQRGPRVSARSNLFMRKYFGAWTKGTGGSLLPAKWLRDGLKELEGEHGETDVYDAFTAFAASKDAKFGPKQFIQNYGRWAVKRQVEVRDNLGD